MYFTCGLFWYAMLMQLNYTAAFDTVDHDVLLWHLKHLMGITDTALGSI